MSTVYTGVGSRNNFNSEVDLVFLFATPLVRLVNPNSDHFKDRYAISQLLEFKKEFKEIKNSLKETKRLIRVHSH
jgi:hypothetical protein